jgi:fructose-bisphosphate aldolase class II
MKTLKEYIKEAKEKKIAIGHFNISNIEGLWAIFNAAKKFNLPVIIGVAEGERKYIGTRQVAALVKSIRDEYNYPIFLNADHTYTVEGVKEAIDAGFDAVIFDATGMSYEENISKTKECVEYAKSKNPEIVVEAELGFIGTSSKVLDGIPKGVKITEEFLTKPSEAEDFVLKTGVDLLAPAVGNIHGMLKGGKDPNLNIKRIKDISESVAVPLVLHGASGNSIDDIKSAIEAGVVIVHINTELRVAFKNGIKKALLEKPDEVAPYKYMNITIEEMQKVVEEKLRVFSNM